MLTIHFDGSCKPRNPGGWATYGFIIRDSAGTIVAQGCGVAAPFGSPHSTNNFAEYAALGFALRELYDRNWLGELQIFGDSKLVVNQIVGAWACNKEHLRKLRDRCRELLAKVSTKYKIEWIPREQNEDADALSRRAFEKETGRKFPERKRVK